MKVLLVSLLSFMLGYLVNSHLTGVSEFAGNLSYNMGMSLDTHVRLKNGQEGELLESATWRIDSEVVQAIALLDNRMLFGEARKNIIDMIDLTLEVRYPEILSALESKKNLVKRLEEDTGVTVNLGLSDNFDDLHNEALQSQIEMIGGYYKARFEQDVVSDTD